ncbi:protoporphyrinogen oxidase HemJ [Paremcibacter congregatus]|jgi:putative membrane protein|uniref:protoporphyrinogen oxidase HemJ n=1 Tax=Paremcibacter congregatus TaxID=2043170 RepID=UPI0030EB44A4|tara:strand:+ start:6226 stop:6669 length:444 start_codon:yes stop_codon:yes gene_type:complete
MIDFFAEYYRYFMALHIIAVISWMAGMFYMPRLFVYHCRLEQGSEASEMFKEMERKLLRIIINPAMIFAWIFGLCMAFGHDLWGDLWFQIKFFCVILMSGFHGYLSRWRKLFARDENTHSENFFRKVNEVPTLLMIAIVFLVILKPF